MYTSKPYNIPAFISPPSLGAVESKMPARKKKKHDENSDFAKTVGNKLKND
jgi:hypothetical protein